jgi:hypothetical protein
MRLVRELSAWLLFAVLCCNFSALAAVERAPDEADVAVLEKSVRAGDRTAVQAAFRLRSKADGAAGEYVDWVLGSLIHRHPKLFLEEVQRSGNLTRLDSILGNLGPTYVDRMAEQTRVLKLRVASLRKVKDPALVEIRNKCLQELNRLIDDRAQSNSTAPQTR